MTRVSVLNDTLEKLENQNLVFSLVGCIIKLVWYCLYFEISSYRFELICLIIDNLNLIFEF